MRKKYLFKIFGVACLILLFYSQLCFADDPLRKLGRGITNTTFGWVEVPAEIFREAERSSEVSGLLITAPLKGFLKAIGRTIVGIYEVATFIIPLPPHYQPIVEPEFVF